MPRILITGAAGFIGQLLAERLLSSSEYNLILSDLNAPPIPPKSHHPKNATAIAADLSDPSSLNHLISSSLPLDAVYIFHGIMSSGAEANFPLGMQVNLHATLALFEALRLAHPQDSTSSTTSKSSSKPPRVIYASSQAVYGQPLPSIIDERVPPTPESSYGAQKFVCETLLGDYTRRGYLDGWSLRFPTICIRPGRPTAAASSFLSGMVREPLNGEACVIPLTDRSFKSWLCSPRTLGENLVKALSVDGEGVLPRHRRVVNLPGVGVTVQEMMDALERVAGKEALQYITEETDPEMERILRSWGTEFDNALAHKLGFQPDGSFEDAVRDYVESLKR